MSMREGMVVLFSLVVGFVMEILSLLGLSVEPGVFLSLFFFFFSSRRRHTRYWRDWSQTCALPISAIWILRPSDQRRQYVRRRRHEAAEIGHALGRDLVAPRFEERVRHQPRLAGDGDERNAAEHGAEIGRASCRERG